MARTCTVGSVEIGQGKPLTIIAGPCVLESLELGLSVGKTVKEACTKLGLSYVFKASFDKANRSSIRSPRGPGIEQGLAWMSQIRSQLGVPTTTDIHEPAQAAPVAKAVDLLQIPAFLCRQTDLLIAAGRTGSPVNVKKGQWMQAEAMAGSLDKVRSGGSTDVAVTERGTFFGYGDLVVDVRNFARLRAATGAAVVFDATHAVQQPGQGAGGGSGGQREHIPALLAAAAVAGADGFFVETHPDPAMALSDAATQWPLDRLDALIGRTLDLWARAHD
jgi:2-dehydro-3-deoxyphosphooctonate aldolase (KDO 8-P synthase)